jgi:NAD(P)-dependent dehydrogenase (short-subunit alcohol dehydrogenase family)
MSKPISRVALLTAGIGLGLAGREAASRLNEADFHGQVALITGSSRGLGLLLAREFAREGCRIVICARDPEELSRAQDILEGEGAEVLAVPCDVSNRTDVERLVTQAVERFGQIDILVNNAGVIQSGPIQTMTIEDFQEAMNAMFWGGVYTTFAVMPQMIRRKSGHIVNITSIGGKVSVPHLLPYCSAKFAAVGFSEGLFAELAQHGIKVTTVAPGLMRTGSFLNAYFKGDKSKEFTWFSVGDNLPVLSIDADQAARLIVQAAKRGKAERTLTTAAMLLERFHGLFPGLTSQILSLVNRFILPPAKTASDDQSRGMVIWARMRSSLLDKLLAWGRDAGERNNEFPGPNVETQHQTRETAH